MKYVNLLFIHISYIFFSNCNVFENRCIYIYKSGLKVNFSLSPLLMFVCFLFLNFSLAMVNKMLV